jgi:WWE domain
MKKAILLFRRGRVDMALDEFQKLVWMCRDPTWLEYNICFNALLSTGICYYLEGSKRKSKIFFEEAIAVALGTNIFSPAVQRLMHDFEARVVRSTSGGGRMAQVFRQFQRPLAPKYSYLELQAKQEIQGDSSHATWYYFIENDPFLEKKDGWYPYDNCTGCKLESMYQAHVADRDPLHVAWPEPELARFFVEIGSAWLSSKYEIDLLKMTQTNMESKMTRPIHRSESGVTPRHWPEKRSWFLL